MFNFNFQGLFFKMLYSQWISDILNGFTKNILTLALFSFAFRMRGVVAIVLYFTK